jgi:hypothetical protein
LSWGSADYESAALTDLAKGDASSHPEHQKMACIAVSPKCCVGKTWGVVVVDSDHFIQYRSITYVDAKRLARLVFYRWVTYGQLFSNNLTRS